MGQTSLAEPDANGEAARTLRPLQAAAITYRVAFGPLAGQKVPTLSPSLSFGPTTLNEIIGLARFRSAYGTTFV
jgi:hypothetical protein